MILKEYKMKTQTVKLESGEAIITKKGIVEWAEIIKQFQNILDAVFEDVGTITESNYVSQGIALVTKYLPDAIKLVATSTDLSLEEVQKYVDIPEILDIIIAIVEVNNLMKVKEKTKNLQTLFGYK